MNNLTLRVFGLVFVLLFAGSLAQTNAQTVSGSIGNGTVTKGKAVRASVVLSIPSGLHVNSSRPGSEYAIPTTIRASAKGIKIGSVNYPRGRNRKFSFSESTINVYEGRATFNFNVTVPASYRGNSISVNVTVKYQACTDEVCYPPKSKQLNLTAVVK